MKEIKEEKLTVISLEITFEGVESRSRRAEPSSILPSKPSPGPWRIRDARKSQE